MNDDVHSPLPWAVIDGVVVSVPVDVVTMVTIRDEPTPRPSHNGLVAIVYGHHVGPQGARVFTHDGNMDFIVRAVNSHGDLLAALVDLWLWATEQRIFLGSDPLPEGLGERCEAAIAKAEGR